MISNWQSESEENGSESEWIRNHAAKLKKSQDCFENLCQLHKTIWQYHIGKLLWCISQCLGSTFTYSCNDMHVKLETVTSSLSWVKVVGVCTVKNFNSSVNGFPSQLTTVGWTGGIPEKPDWHLYIDICGIILIDICGIIFSMVLTRIPVHTSGVSLSLWMSVCDKLTISYGCGVLDLELHGSWGPVESFLYRLVLESELPLLLMLSGDELSIFFNLFFRYHLAFTSFLYSSTSSWLKILFFYCKDVSLSVISSHCG